MKQKAIGTKRMLRDFLNVMFVWLASLVYLFICLLSSSGVHGGALKICKTISCIGFTTGVTQSGATNISRVMLVDLIFLCSLWWRSHIHQHKNTPSLVFEGVSCVHKSCIVCNKDRLDGSLSNLIWFSGWQPCQQQGLELDGIRGTFQPKPLDVSKESLKAVAAKPMLLRFKK